MVVHRLKRSGTWQPVQHLALSKARSIELIGLLLDKAGMVALDLTLAGSSAAWHYVIVHKVVVCSVCAVPAFLTCGICFERLIVASFQSGLLENGNQIEVVELGNTGYWIV